MAIPRYDTFSNATAKKRKGLSKARGSNIAKVDLARYTYWQRIDGADSALEIQLLYGIVKACTDWLKKKYDKNEFTWGIFGRTNFYDEQFTRRPREIKSLANEAVNRLFTRMAFHGLLTTDERGTLHFAQRKVQSLGAYRHERRGLKAMGRDYQSERTTYLQSGKVQPISGSGVHQTHHFLRNRPEGLDGITPNVRKIGAKDVDKLTPDDFRILDALGRKNLLTGDVNYLSKRQRLRYMAVCDGHGKLVDTGGNRITLQGDGVRHGPVREPAPEGRGTHRGCLLLQPLVVQRGG